MLEELHDRFPQKTTEELKTLLGSLLFPGDRVEKRIGDLSGGEKARVAFAVLMMTRANVLILDEPTNHLDTDAKEVLDAALAGFEGTILLVSHDRYLLNRVPTRILSLAADHLVSTEGGYDAFLEAQERRGAADRPAVAEKKPDGAVPKGSYRTKAQRAADTRQKQLVKALETELAALEHALEELTAALQQQEVAADYERLSKLLQEQQALSERRDAVLAEWLAVSED